VQPVTLAVANAMTFRSLPATLFDPKSLLPATKASDIKYADLAQSTPYSRLSLYCTAARRAVRRLLYALSRGR